ncbi:MAG TPA: VIT domain-containing protein [Thermoanaerobaculia bacterium]|nr:VIT domain-containing protein [Thermoanaerobaculia bacterium]
MQGYSRSLLLTASLLVGAAVSLLMTAAPAEERGRAAAGASAAVGTAAGPAALHQAPVGTPAPRQSGWAPQRPASEIQPPISMCDPDGQELILEDLSIRAAIHGMLSLTEMEFRFRNPTSRRIEGRFTTTLPPDSAISRWAMEVNGRLMEGEVIERLKANQVYEQFLHRMRDPALLEQDQGNRFSARIFPIEPNAPVRLILSYTRLLPLRDGVRTYDVPLRGMPKMAHFSFRAQVAPLPGEESTTAAASDSFRASGVTRSSVDVFTVDERDYTPPRDIELSWRPASGANRSRILRAGDFYLAAFRPAVGQARLPVLHNWIFYIDTSASAAEGTEHRIRALQSIFGALPESDRVRVFAFDNDVVQLRSGTARDLARSIDELLRARMFLGGTDLAAAIRHAGRTAANERDAAIVFVSDLVPTLGATSSSDVNDAVRALPGGTAAHALILGARDNAPAARALTAGRGRVIRVPFSDTLDARAREAAASLRVPLGASVDVTDAGAEWFYPHRIDDVHPGHEVIILGKTRAGAQPGVRLAQAVSAGEDTGASITSLTSGTFAPLLEREGYRAYLDFLAEREANEPSEAVRKALATEQVRISTEQRVVIPRTTMLVLETEFDYQRFGIDRRALAAILTIDAGGITRIDRTREQPLPAGVARREMRQAVPPPTAPMPFPASPPPPPLMQSAPMEERDAAGVPVGAVSGMMAERIAVPADEPATAQAPRSRVGNLVRSDSLQRPFKKSDEAWINVRRPSGAQIDALYARLRQDPRDREVYNQLSDALVLAGRWEALRSLALQWQPYDADNPQVYEILGLAGEELGKDGEAARAYASLIEVAPAKTELLQRAGLLLVRVNRARVAESPLRRALELRPDRVNSYRHLALMLWLDGRPEEAARVLESATRQTFPGWYGDAQRVVRDELGYVYRSWAAEVPQRRAEIADRAREHNVDLERRDALRVSLAWETDANDVDLHVIDPAGEQCYYSNPRTASGLELYGDITQGLGPEVIRTSRVIPGTYHVGVRYFAAGPMGVSRGLVIVMRDETVSVHPFRLVEGGKEIRYVTGVRMK